MICYLLLGSNLGRRERYLERARRAIKGWAKTEIRRASSIWETEPMGPVSQRRFLNQVIEADSELAPMALLIWAKKTEIELGRRTSIDQGPRKIDIDIIGYGAIVFRHPYLQIPHPMLAKRPFALAPLKELYPGWKHPVLGVTVAELSASLGTWIKEGMVRPWGKKRRRI